MLPKDWCFWVSILTYGNRDRLSWITKIEVSEITGFFSEILEHSHFNFLAHLHDKISSWNQTESYLDSIFASLVPFYICVLCYSSAVQLRGPLHQKKNTVTASFDLCPQNSTTHCGFAQNSSGDFEKSYSHFQCSTQTEITQTDYLCVQNPTVTKLFATEEFSLPD